MAERTISSPVSFLRSCVRAVSSFFNSTGHAAAGILSGAMLIGGIGLVGCGPGAKANFSLGGRTAHSTISGADKGAPNNSSPTRFAAALPSSITGTDGTSTGTASFQGNFTGVTPPAGQSYFFLQRQPDCSLTFTTGTSMLKGSAQTGSAAFSGNTPHYEKILHQLASLTTEPDAFAGGCAASNAGISSRLGVWVGETTKGIDVLASTLSSISSGTNVLATLDYNSATGQFSTNFNGAGSLAYATGLATADLNGDGNSDLVVVNGYNAPSAFVSVLLANADGTFHTGVDYSIAGDYSTAAVIDDVNGDGKLDIVAVSQDQQISVLLGKGDGTFQSAMSFAAPTLPGYTSASQTPINNLITADVNNDGKKDVIGSNGLVLLGDGDGTFTAAPSAAFPYTPGISSEGPNLAAGDLNNDGKADLVLSTGTAISTWIGKGDGTFTQGNSYASVNDTGYVTVTDLDGDGNADVYVGLSNGGAFSGDDSNPNLAYALMGNGDGTFVGAPQIRGSYNGTNMGDVNGDGVPDLITNGTVNAPTAAFAVQVGDGKGGFTTASTITAPANFVLSIGGVYGADYTFTNANTSVAATYAVADINGDGKADLVWVDNGLASTSSSVIYPGTIYFTALSNGDGTFQTPVPHVFPQIAPAADFDNSLTVSGLQIADFNHDGHNDLIVAYNETGGASFGQPPINSYNQGLAVLLGNGDGTFSTTPILTSTYSSNTAPATGIVPQITNVADLNGDGNSDLIVDVVGTGGVINFQLQTQLEVFVGNGDGTFKPPVTIPVGADSYGTPVIADLNKDGRLDLATLAETSGSQAELVVLPGNGDGTFATPTIVNLTGGDAIRSAYLAGADFDGDGKIDLALLDALDFSGIFYGKGDGTFTSVPESGYVVPKDLLYLAAGGPAVAADLNKGGKPDILAGNTVLLNIYGSAPTAMAATTTALAASATTVAAGASVTFTATITGASGSSGTPTGTVTFMDGTTTLGTGTLNGSAATTYTTTSLSTGVHSITAVYAGDTNFSGSTSSAVTVTVNAAPPVIATTTALTASATSAITGIDITFTATVTPATGTAIPTGTVTFTDGATSLGTGTLGANGSATLSTTNLAVGTHSITAGYGGDSNFGPSASSAVTVTISTPAPDFSLSISPGSGSESGSSPATATVTVTPTNGFSSTVSFACSGLPSGLSCSFNPSTVTPAGAAISTSLSIAGTLSAQNNSERGNHAASLEFCGLGLGLLILARTRKYRQFFIVFSLLILALVAVNGCGSSGRKSQSANVSVTATAGSTSHSITYPLTINP